VCRWKKAILGVARDEADVLEKLATLEKGDSKAKKSATYTWRVTKTFWRSRWMSF
jgi:hypothetical protein